MDSPKKGFILLVSLIVMVMVAALILDWLQQEILRRYQSQAFLDTQSLHQEFKGVSVEALTQLQTQTRSSLEQSSFSLLNTSFSPAYSDWSGSSKFSSSKLLLTLRNDKTGAPVDFEVLLHLATKDLTRIPWVIFSPTSPLFPDNLNLDNQSFTLSSQATDLFWLTAGNSGDTFDDEITGNTEMTLKGSNILLTQGGVFLDNITLSNGGTLALKVIGNLELSVNFDVLSLDKILIQSTGNLDLILPEQAQSFSSAASVTFLEVAGDFNIQGKDLNSTHVQMNTYVFVEGNCLQTDAALQSIYWKGSLACKNSPNFQTPMYLKYSAFTPDNSSLSIPSAFMRNTLQPDGVEALKMK